MRPSLSLIILISCIVPVIADDADTAVRRARMADMSARAKSLSIRIGGKPNQLSVQPDPLFRYSDAARTTTDGTLWLWERDGQPVASVCMFNDSREGFQWNYELVSLSEEPLVMSGRTDWNWRPEAVKRIWMKVQESAPANTEFARLAQMKEILTQLRAEEDLDGDLTQLRLLPRPVHRYQAPSAKVKDGALFLFVTGTNPEIIVQIEALDESPPEWRIGFARLTSAVVTVVREKEKVWSAGRVLEWNPLHEYFSHYGPDLNLKK